MSVIPLLGISNLRASGQPLTSVHDPQMKVACDWLVQSTTIPSQKGRFLKAHVDDESPKSESLLFEPPLEPLGLGTQVTLATIHSDGMVLMPVHNFQGIPARLEKGAQLGAVRPFHVPSEVVIGESGSLGDVLQSTY